MVSKYKKYKYNSMQLPIEVVNISIIGSAGVADGKMLPVVFLDTTERPDIRETIMNHKYVQSGDVSTAWLRFSKNDYENLFLSVKIKNPNLCDFLIHFIVGKHGPGIDLIIANGGCYIQSSTDGMCMRDDLNAPKVLMEVIGRDFYDEWSKIYRIGMINMIKKNHKVSAREALKLADLKIEEMRKINVKIK